MAEMQWIKLRIDMFDDEKIKIIQAMPDGDALLVVWIRLIALAGKCNANGLVLVDDEFPYTDEMLAVIFNKPLQTVKLALQTFEKFHMLENTVRGIYVTNFGKHQNIEGMDRIREQNRIRKQRQRKQQAALLQKEASSDSTSVLESVTDSVTKTVCEDDVTSMSRDMSRDVTQQREDKEKEEDNNNISPKGDIVGKNFADPQADQQVDPESKPLERLIYARITDDFHRICTDFPSVRAISDSRRRQIRTLLNELDKLKIMRDKTPYERLSVIFQMAQDSDFLSGRNGKWDGCSFDWIINKANALKILEGNYANKGGSDNGSNSTNTRNNGKACNGHDGTLDNTTAKMLERFIRNSGG